MNCQHSRSKTHAIIASLSAGRQYPSSALLQGLSWKPTTCFILVYWIFQISIRTSSLSQKDPIWCDRLKTLQPWHEVCCLDFMICCTLLLPTRECNHEASHPDISTKDNSKGNFDSLSFESEHTFLKITFNTTNHSRTAFLRLPGKSNRRTLVRS